MRFQYGFLCLQPTGWVQSLHTKRGAALRLNAKLDSNSAFIISGVRSVSGIRIGLAFTRGKYDWQIPDAPEGARGFLAYHSADGDIEFDFLGGGCSLSEEIYDDLWHRIKSSNYDQCHITGEVGPVELDYDGEATWDRNASEFLYILDLEIFFTRSGKISDEKR